MERVRAIITYAKPWEMEDEQTRKMRRGVSVEFLLTESLDSVANDDGSVGYRHSKESLPFDKQESIKEVPGVYELEFTLAPGAKGKLSTKLSNVHFVESL